MAVTINNNNMYNLDQWLPMELLYTIGLDYKI